MNKMQNNTIDNIEMWLERKHYIRLRQQRDRILKEINRVERPMKRKENIFLAELKTIRKMKKYVKKKCFLPLSYRKMLTQFKERLKVNR